MSSSNQFHSDPEKSLISSNAVQTAFEQLTIPNTIRSVFIEIEDGEALKYQDLIDQISELEWQINEYGLESSADRLAKLNGLEDALNRHFELERSRFLAGELRPRDLLAQLRMLDQPLGVLAEYSYADFYFWHFIGLEATNPRSEQLSANMTPFIPSPLSRIELFLQEAKIQDTDTVVDLGSGHGPVVPFLGLFSEARKVIGIDYLVDHVQTGNQIAQELNLKHIEFQQQDARHFDFSVGDVFFLYQPFSGPVLEQVVKELSREAEQRDIRVFCIGNCGREFERSKSFKRVDYFSVQDEWSPRLLRSAHSAREVMLDPTFAFLQS